MIFSLNSSRCHAAADENPIAPCRLAAGRHADAGAARRDDFLADQPERRGAAARGGAGDRIYTATARGHAAQCLLCSARAGGAGWRRCTGGGDALFRGADAGLRRSPPDGGSALIYRAGVAASAARDQRFALPGGARRLSGILAAASGRDPCCAETVCTCAPALSLVAGNAGIRGSHPARSCRGDALLRRSGCGLRSGFDAGSLAAARGRCDASVVTAGAQCPSASASHGRFAYADRRHDRLVHADAPAAHRQPSPVASSCAGARPYGAVAGCIVQ